MRLFTGLSLPEEVTGRLTDLYGLAALKWSPQENLHITIKFIGEWPEARLAELKDALAAMPKRGAIAVSVAGLDYFPNAGNPKVLFAGVRAGADLMVLASATDAVLQELGCAREMREYSPHVTLARVDGRRNGALHETIASMNDFEFGRFEAAEFHLYLSRAGRGGSVYTKLASYPLA